MEKETKTASVFETLSKINVNEHVETKGAHRYLSWVWAWGIIKGLYPTATTEVHKTPDGCIYHTDGRTAWVEVSVTIEGITHTELYPIFSPKYDSLPLEKVTASEANKSIQRAFARCAARHGLGLYIYAGEDLPQDPTEAIEEAKRCETIEALTEVWNKHVGYQTDRDFVEIIKIKGKELTQKDK